MGETGKRIVYGMTSNNKTVPILVDSDGKLATANP